MELKVLPPKLTQAIIAKHRSFKIIMTVLITLVLVSTSGYIAWLIYLKPQTQFFTGINFYRQKIIVSIQGKEQLLDLFDTYHFPIETNGKVEISIRDVNNQVLQTKTHTVPLQTGLFMDIWAENTDLNQCVAKSRVTDTYYVLNQPQTGENYTEITVPEIVVNTPANSFYTPLSLYEDKYVFLDTYKGNNLPGSIDPFVNVYGYYFVPCNDLNSTEKMVEWIKWWRNYTPDTQRTQYEVEIQRINNSTEYL